MESHHQRLGPCTIVGDLVDVGTENMLQCDFSEHESQNVERFPILDKKPEVTLKGETNI